jgi:hypothetical protein
MTSDDRDEELDQMLRGLMVHDVGAARVERTRDKCRTVLAARAAARRRPGARLILAAGRRWAAMSWAEPLATLALSALYLTAAVAASLTLLRLGPPR